MYAYLLECGLGTRRIWALRNRQHRGDSRNQRDSMTTTKNATPKTTRKKRRSTNVPGQFYGYVIQVTRSVAHLLRARPGQAVSVEHLDDVATQGPDGVLAEQDKSGLTHNPVADRSVDLWKTLHNWVRAIRDGALKLDTKFVLYVAQDHHGDVIDRIHQVTNKADADALVQKLRNEFWGNAPRRAARAKLPADLGEHVNGVLAASDDVVALLFTNLTLEKGSGAPNDDLLPLIAAKAISDGACEEVLFYLLGWADRTIKKLVEKRLPAILPYEDFHNQLVGAARKFDRSENLLRSTQADISQADVDKELRARTYVRQLEAVKCEESALVQAVNDFLRSAVDRTTWSERGDVIEGSFCDFEDGLERAWYSQRTRVEIEHRTAVEEDRGRLLYANCSSLQMRLQGMDVPMYFVPGSVHTLADSLRIGWHPRYRDFFRADGLNEQAVKGQAATAPAATSGHSFIDEGGGA